MRRLLETREELTAKQDPGKKSKKISLEKKLNNGKTAIASLNDSQKSRDAGGLNVQQRFVTILDGHNCVLQSC